MMKTRRKQFAWPIGAAVLGSSAMALLYVGIVSLAESPAHALELFWDDRLIVLPIILGFGVQAGLYTILRKRLFLPQSVPGHGAGPAAAAYTGASGGMSTMAMVACCAHHVTDLLPILGLTAAATFLAQYRVAFMVVGLGTTLLGILAMLRTLQKERQKALQISYAHTKIGSAVEAL